jgi:hypothetical protein
MTIDTALHIVEIVVIGAPIWWYVIRRAILDKEYPPHIHEYDHKGYPTIRFPRGYAPGTVQAINGGMHGRSQGDDGDDDS